MQGPHPQLAGVLLAGGRSRRMGRDKARLLFLGEPLIARAVRRMAQAARQVVVVAREPARYAFTGVACVPDVLPQAGPLAGLWSGALTLPFPYFVAGACDMPFFNPRLALGLLHLLVEDDLDAAVPRDAQGREQPLHGVYRRAAFLEAAARALRQEQYAIRAAWPYLRLRIVPPDLWRRWDPDGLAFRNANTPEEWRALRDLASSTADA